MSEGWICPKCGQVWAPFINRCECSPYPMTYPPDVPTVKWPPFPNNPLDPYRVTCIQDKK